MLLPSLDCEAPFGCRRLADCVLLAEKTNFVDSPFDRNGLKPLYGDEIFAAVGIINEFAVVVASRAEKIGVGFELSHPIGQPGQLNVMRKSA